MKSNILTIVKKEIHRFFGDRSLVFTSIIMPGLLIYLIYSLMGSYIPNIVESSSVESEYVNPLTPEEQVAYDSLSAKVYAAQFSADEEVSDQQELGKLLSGIFPMLMITLLFSGSMAVAPTSIAGEKERGTIATLLVTPLRRSELAIGKILALSFFALLSGISSFLGIILSLPKLLQLDQLPVDGSFYGTSDYLKLFLIIICTTLVIISLISILSALAKSVKAATTMVSPLMILVMLVGLSPMLVGDSTLSWAAYLIPVFNSVQVLSSVLAFSDVTIPLLITLASNLAFSALAVWALTRMFNSERIMFSK